MTRWLVALLLLTPLPILALAEEPDPEPPGSGSRQLQGEWEAVSLKTSGREVKLGGTAYSMTFTKDRMIRKITTKGKSREQTYTCKIDPRKSPAHIDITFTATSQTFYGLYKVKGDELTFTQGSTDPKVRPKDFESALRVMVLKRKKK
jgi:uncharacterized protein (TIGR03067 family)